MLTRHFGIHVHQIICLGRALTKIHRLYALQSFNDGIYAQQRSSYGHAAPFPPSQTEPYDPRDPRLTYTDVLSHGGLYSVGYLDLGHPAGPTVLMVHGAPGGATDFDAITDRLTANGVRVLAPNLPGTPITKLVEGRSTFNLSTSHRAQFTIDFLECLEINSVDVALGHSLGGTAVLNLAATTTLAKSAALLNAVGHIAHRKVKPYWLLQLMAYGLEFRFTKSSLKKYVQYRFEKVGFKVEDLDHLVTGAITQARLEFNQVRAFTERIGQKGLPVLYAFCQNDRLLEWEIPLASSTMAGVPPTHASYFDDDGQLTSGPSPDEVLACRSLVFATGGHYAHKHHTAVVTQCLMDLVHSVSTDQPDFHNRHHSVSTE